MLRTLLRLNRDFVDVKSAACFEPPIVHGPVVRGPAHLGGTTGFVDIAHATKGNEEARLCTCCAYVPSTEPHSSTGAPKLRKRFISLIHGSL